MTLTLSSPPCPWVSCSQSAVTDLNNSLSQLSLSPRHGGVNQLLWHDAARGGGEKDRECQRGRDRERGTQEEGRCKGPSSRVCTGVRTDLAGAQNFIPHSSCAFFVCLFVFLNTRFFVFHISALNANSAPTYPNPTVFHSDLVPVSGFLYIAPPPVPCSK